MAPVRDLNVMVRRGLWRAQVDRWTAGLHADGDIRIAIATSSSVRFDVLDALVLDDGEVPPPDFSGYLVQLAKI